MQAKVHDLDARIIWHMPHYHCPIRDISQFKFRERHCYAKCASLPGLEPATLDEEKNRNLRDLLYRWTVSMQVMCPIRPSSTFVVSN